jgi:hypothetical protein
MGSAIVLVSTCWLLRLGRSPCLSALAYKFVFILLLDLSTSV